MRTTVRLEDGLFERVKREALNRNTTFTALIEEGLQLVLARARQPVASSSRVVPVARERGGTLPGVDLNHSATLLDVMDGRS